MSELIGKEYILERLDPIQIYEHYLGIEVSSGKSIMSPFRKETRASFNIYYNGKGQLVWKDFAGEWGTVFDFVMLMFNCTLPVACRKIANDLNLLTIDGTDLATTPKREVIRPPKKEVIIKFNKRPWAMQDIDFWDSFGIDFKTLEEYGVVPIRSYQLINGENEMTFHQKIDMPSYLYDYGIDRVKIYTPHAKDKRYKFVGNTKGDDIFGLYQLKLTNQRLSLEEGKPYISHCAILCAGQKDVMSIWHMAGIRAICLGSESTRMTQQLLEKIRPHCEHLLVCYDNDKTGIANAEKISKEFALPVIHIRKFTMRKDISDFFKSGGNHEPLHKQVLALIDIQEKLII